MSIRIAKLNTGKFVLEYRERFFQGWSGKWTTSIDHTQYNSIASAEKGMINANKSILFVVKYGV